MTDGGWRGKWEAEALGRIIIRKDERKEGRVLSESEPQSKSVGRRPV